MGAIFCIVLLFGEVVGSLFYLSLDMSDMALVSMMIFQFITVGIGIKYARAQKKKRQLRRENEELGRRVQIEYLYYKMEGMKEEEIRKIRHDLANHLQVLKGLKESRRKDAALTYQEKIFSSYLKMEELEKELKNEIKSIVLAKRGPSLDLDMLTLKELTVLVLGAASLLLILLQFIRVQVLGPLSVVVIEFVFCISYLGFSLYKVRQEENKKAVLDTRIWKNASQKEDRNIVNQIYNLSQNLHELSEKEEERTLEEIFKYSFETITGMEAVDAMLNSKAEYCKSEHIDINYDIRLLDSCTMNPADLTGLLGNLLDNAAEACLRIQGKRYISLLGRMRSNILLLKLENSKVKDERPELSGYETTKKEKAEHGYGLKIVETIVQRYDGLVEYDNQGDSFKVVVSLPQEINKHKIMHWIKRVNS